MTMTPAVDEARAEADRHTLIDLRLRLSGGLWRLTALWGFLAGAALAWMGNSVARSFDWQGLTTLVLGLILADALWGAVWSQATSLHRDSAFARPTSLPAWPYASPRAPGTRLWAWLSADGGHGSRDMWLALLFAVILAVVLGQPAVLATTVMAILVLIAAILVPVAPAIVRLLGAMVGIALPWWLGYQLFATPAASLWPTLAQPLLWFLPLAFALIRFALDQKRGGASWLWLWAASVLLAAGLVAQSYYLAAILAAIPLLFVLLRAGRLSPARQEMGCWLALALTLLGVLLA